MSSLLLQLTIVKRVISVTCLACRWSDPSVEGDPPAKGKDCHFNFKGDNKRSWTGLTGLGVILISSHSCINSSSTPLCGIRCIKTDYISIIQL